MADDHRLVVHVTRSLGWGGLERVVLDLARAVDPARYRAAVISLSDDLGRAAQFAEAGIPVEVVPQRGLDTGLPLRLARRLRALGAAVVLAHNYGRFFYAGPAARLARIPALYTEHSNTRPDERALWLTQRLFSRSAAAIVAVSPSVREQLVAAQRLDPRRLEVIPNGIDLAPYAALPDRRAAKQALGLPPEVPVIGHVGRLVPVKNQALLLAAMARLAPAHPEARLVIAGDGPLRDELTGAAARLGLAERVHWLGRRDDVPAVLAAMDLFCLCSHSEGLPLALIEAMAAGVAVVATQPAGGDLVLPGETGLLCEPGAPEPLAAALGELLGAPARRESMAARARAVAQERYSIATMARAYTAVFDRVLAQPTR